MNPPAAETGCELMKRLAKDLKKTLHDDEAHATKLAQKIAELEAQSPPDEQQINALKQALELLRKKIEDERAALSELEEVISQNC
ncbi:hypothetical protein GCM10010302_55600 [Streptomyces polychromogenes]|uniref:Uncharacterized protein n=1 Tax=Streptomyces polychromogenes TaxID=67342 RepID=A0ABN0VL59_9ACTN